MLPIIGITGKARAGKDEIAKIIIQLRGGYRYAFADPLKAMTDPLIGRHEDIEREGLKETSIPWLGRSPRYLWQTLGTEWGRNLIHPDLWVILADQYLIGRGVGMIVSDVRFENEATWIRNQGGRLIHVRRPDTEEVGVKGHKSEKGIDFKYPDIAMVNSGTLHQLYTNVQQLLKIIGDLDDEHYKAS